MSWKFEWKRRGLRVRRPKSEVERIDKTKRRRDGRRSKRQRDKGTKCRREKTGVQRVEESKKRKSEVRSPKSGVQRVEETKSRKSQESKSLRDGRRSKRQWDKGTKG